MDRVQNIVLGLILGLAGLFMSVCGGGVMYGELFGAGWGLWIFALPALALGIWLIVIAWGFFSKGINKNRN
jgi:hypothetical protein